MSIYHGHLCQSMEHLQSSEYLVEEQSRNETKSTCLTSLLYCTLLRDLQKVWTPGKDFPRWNTINLKWLGKMHQGNLATAYFKARRMARYWDVNQRHQPQRVKEWTPFEWKFINWTFVLWVHEKIINNQQSLIYLGK